MKAPLEILRRSIYFTEHISQNDSGVTSTFWFESGKWYKSNRSISLQWNIVERSEHGYAYAPSQDVIEMRQHLREYFGARA